MADKTFIKSFLFFYKLPGTFSANYASFFGAMTEQVETLDREQGHEILLFETFNLVSETVM